MGHHRSAAVRQKREADLPTSGSPQEFNLARQKERERAYLQSHPLALIVRLIRFRIMIRLTISTFSILIVIFAFSIQLVVLVFLLCSLLTHALTSASGISIGDSLGCDIPGFRVRGSQGRLFESMGELLPSSSQSRKRSKD